MESIIELENLLKEKINEENIFNSGATDSEISECESKMGVAFPQELKMLYKHANGQTDASPIINGYWFNSLNDMCESYLVIKKMIDNSEIDDCLVGEPVGPVKPLYHSSSWLPLFGSDNSNLSVDLDPDNGGVIGQIIEVFYDDEIRTVLSSGTSEFIHTLIDKINNNVLRFDEDYEYFVSGEDDSFPNLFGINT